MLRSLVHKSQSLRFALQAIQRFLYLKRDKPDFYEAQDLSFFRVVLRVELKCVTSVINSEINDYIIRQNLQVCEVLIKRDQHTFKKPLKKDSYVDCREICPVSENELFNLQGVLSDEAKQAVIKAVNDCRVLQRRYKKMILNQLNQ